MPCGLQVTLSDAEQESSMTNHAIAWTLAAACLSISASAPASDECSEGFWPMLQMLGVNRDVHASKDRKSSCLNTR